jgi:hypothetical protein
MADMLAPNSVNSGNGQNPVPASPAPPPWLAASAAEFRLKRRILRVVRPIRAASFGGILVFLTLLTFLLRHSPQGQSVLLVISLCGLPLCLAAWFVASSVYRRLRRSENHIARLMYDAGMHVDDQGRVLTDNPHPVLIIDAATGGAPNMSSPSLMEGR